MQGDERPLTDIGSSNIFQANNLGVEARFRYASCEKKDYAQGSKAKYTSKQKRQAEHIEESYEKRGAPKRVWQTVNKQTGGGEKSGGGRKATGFAKNAARKESGQRAARSRKVGSRPSAEKSHSS